MLPEDEQLVPTEVRVVGDEGRRRECRNLHTRALAKRVLKKTIWSMGERAATGTTTFCRSSTADEE